MSSLDETNIGKYDWDKLREDLVTEDSFTNKTIIVRMPTPEETAIQAALDRGILRNTSSGIYPVRNIS